MDNDEYLRIVSNFLALDVTEGYFKEKALAFKASELGPYACAVELKRYLMAGPEVPSQWLRY